MRNVKNFTKYFRNVCVHIFLIFLFSSFSFTFFFFFTIFLSLSLVLFFRSNLRSQIYKNYNEKFMMIICHLKVMYKVVSTNCDDKLFCIKRCADNLFV